MFNDKVVLITGGTGSFGHKFVQTIVRNYEPKKLIIYSRDELKQHEMSQLFSETTYKFMRYFIGDVRDKERLIMAMRDTDYVIHAAALKQVPAAEYNPMECIKTNIFGAQNVIEASIFAGVKKVIALSTDKAASPINLYGASKLAADKLFVAANNISGESGTQFSVVRYGNVVGSRGSVVPYFKKLIEQNTEFLPITHEKMTRFWINLQEGVDFVIKNFDRMRGGEIFVPKLPSVRIVDLAKAMAPHIQQKIVGIRPGEKIHEIMCPADDSHLTLEFNNHYVIQPSISFSEQTNEFSINQLGELGSLVQQGFEYSSGTNTHFLDRNEIIEMNALVGIKQVTSNAFA
ncbi:MAG: UDP-N-acetylglucosamine 4,6-dehydratase (inverting) [Gammaproteobacteria bacterium]|nr:UDP-N-acetylglucosamine 4,6-dehydratase (inverting) [Gammaproteobacteria bacterium]